MMFQLINLTKGWRLIALLLLTSQLCLTACDSASSSVATNTPLASSPDKLDAIALQNAAAKLEPAKTLNEPDYGFTTPGGITPHAPNQGSLLADLQISNDASDNSLNFSGTLEGGHFGLKFPPDWNGELVLYAHGFRQAPASTGTIFGGGGANNSNQTQRQAISGSPAVNSLFQNLLSQKYAYGYSDYAKPNGYSVKSGIESIQLLKKLVEIALPVKRTYVLGESMGGNVLMGLIEKYPNDYAGAMSLCGVVAGWYEEVRSISDFRVIYDYFTKPLGAPIVLPNAGAINPNKNDPAFTPGVVYGSLNALFNRAKTEPTIANIIKQISQVTGINPDFISYLTMLFAANPDTQDLALTTGGEGYSNRGKIYKGSDDDAALNAGVQRVEALPAATAYLNNWYTPQGTFKTRLLSVHNLIDPLVPYEFEGLLKAQVAAKNNSQNLSQQIVDGKPVNPNAPLAGGPIHCYFSASQLNFAWNGLRDWVEKNIRPQDGLNITDKS